MNKVVFYVMTKGFEVFKHAISIKINLISFVVVGKDHSLRNDYSDDNKVIKRK